jgi:hypothetical protein
MTLAQALEIVRAAGYRVSKPRSRKTNGNVKDRVGLTFVATFADGQVTRMSTFTSLANLDLGRGLRLSQAAYEARARRSGKSLHPVPPPIVHAHFEQDGNVLATYDDPAGVLVEPKSKRAWAIAVKNQETCHERQAREKVQIRHPTWRSR